MAHQLEICREILQKNKISAFLISDFYNVGYLSGFFPLSPQEREVFLLLTAPESFLLTDGRYIHRARAQKTGFNCLETTPHQNFFQIIALLCQKKKIGELAFEKENLTVFEYEKLKKALRGTKLIPCQNLVEEKRALKTASELKSIKKACQIADQAFSHLLKFLKPGLSEKEVADEIEWFIRKKGVYPEERKRRRATISFDPIVASGENSAFPHHRSGARKLRKRDLVLLDFGAKVEDYSSDMTRVVFLGKTTPEQKKLYRIVLEAQKLAIKHLGGGRMDSSEVESLGIKARGVDKIARSYIISHGYPTLPHGLGHGVGLSEHEAPHLFPKSKDILKPGMVFSVEPGIYLPGKFGVRIENLVVLTKSGPQILTKSPKGIIEL